MKIYKETGKFLICFCPQHQEENASFIINKCFHNGKPKGYSYCFSCGHRADYSPEFVDSMSKKPTRFREQVPIDWHGLAVSFLVAKIDEGFQYLEKLTKEWNINIETLFSYYVGWVYEGHGAYTIPMRFANEVFCGIQLRYPSGRKFCIESSQLGLFIPYILLDRPVVITEGFSDAAIATDCGFFGLGRPSAQSGSGMILDFLQLNTIKDVTIVADQDKNGIGQKSAEKLGDLLEQNDIGCRIVLPGGVKDLRKLHQMWGKDKTIKFLKGN